MPYRMPVVKREVSKGAWLSRSAWHAGGAGQKRSIRAVRDRAVRTAPAAGDIARCSRRTFLCKQLSESTLTCIPTASRANLRLQLLCPSPGAIGC